MTGDLAGFGLAMKDDLIDDPYFYLSGYLPAGELEMKNLPPLPFGHWESGAWKGAVLPIREFYLSENDPLNIIDGFIKLSFQWYQENFLSSK